MLEKLYLSSPICIQELLINIQGFRIKKRRLNKSFKLALEKYTNTNPHTLDIEQLRYFLKSAEETSYWNKAFKEYKVNVNAKDLVAEISKLPILSKNTVKDNPQDFINERFTKKSFKSTTSGTTGSPLSFITTHTMENRLWAIWERNRRLHGIQEKSWMGWFGGKTIVPISQTKPPYWRTCYPLKQVMFSAYHLNKNTVAEYHDKLNNSKISWIHSYPSFMAIFASLVESQELGDLPHLEIITLGSETLLKHQETLIKRVFPNVKILQHYGQGEGVAIINQDSDLEFYPEKNFSYVEFLPHNRENSEFKIVGTNFNNLAFPLIRYDTGDLCTITDNKIQSIDGRIEDYITLPNGIKIGRLSHIVKVIDSIEESQFYQPDKHHLILRIVKRENYDDVDTKKLIKSIRERLGHEINVDIEFMEKIPKTKNGKLRYVISEVKD